MSFLLPLNLRFFSTLPLNLFLKGTGNERKVLATSPRSDLREYRSGMPALTASKSVKRPCEDEQVKFCSIILTLTHVLLYLYIQSKYKFWQNFQNVQLQEIKKNYRLSFFLPVSYKSGFFHF